MKKIKQYICLFSAILIFFTLSTEVLAIETTEIPDQTIYFEVPESWGEYTDVYCYIMGYESKDSPFGWQSKRTKCSPTEVENLYSYNIAEKGLPLRDSGYYSVIFSTNKGHQTYETLFNYECYGDVLFCDGRFLEDSSEYYNELRYVAYWRNQNSSKFGPVKSISSGGDIVGSCLPPGKASINLFNEFLDNWFDFVKNKTEKSDQEIINEAAYLLDLTVDTTYVLVSVSGKELDWKKEAYEEFLNENNKILGDANLDTDVNVKDATAIQKHIANLIILTEAGFVVADVDGSGTVNIKDATAIQKHVAGIKIGFAIGLPVGN